MRDVINKNITEADVLSAAQQAFDCGYTSLKLYFIIGLPMEEDADVEAIADLCLRIRDLGRRSLGPKSGRLQLSVSVNNFVPKPFTPFQWAAMTDRPTLRRRQELLRSRLRKPGIKVALHDVDKSYLEAALARGGEEMAPVILEAWKHGARFDSWTEQFSAAAWSEALALDRQDGRGGCDDVVGSRRVTTLADHRGCDRHGLSAGGVGARSADGADSGLSRGECRDCGACGPGIAIDLARQGGARRAARSNPLEAGSLAEEPGPARLACRSRGSRIVEGTGGPLSTHLLRRRQGTVRRASGQDGDFQTGGQTGRGTAGPFRRTSPQAPAESSPCPLQSAWRRRPSFASSSFRRSALRLCAKAGGGAAARPARWYRSSRMKR